MAQRPVKFGILSTANIANTVVNAMKVVEEAECLAVASRDINKAKSFAETHDISKACSYSELLTLPINAVYIPLPTAIATDWAVLSARAGKHILVGKPLGSTQAVQHMTQACQDANVFFLDGTHFVHSARTKEVQKRISAGDIGSIRSIETSFSFPINGVAENIRSDTKLEPMGFLGDLAWYCARAAVTFLGPEVTSEMLSVACTARFHPQFPDCTQRGAGLIEFGTSSDCVIFSYAFDSASALNQRVTIIGELGTLEILDFVEPRRQSSVFQQIRLPERFTTETEYTYDRTVSDINDGNEFQMVIPPREHIVVKEPDNFTQSQAMIHEFCRLILEDDKRSAKRWAREALATQAILDAIMVEG